MEPPYRQPAPVPDPLGQSADHLHLLSVFHYVVAGIMALFALFPVIHLVLGIAMLAAPTFFTSPTPNDPASFIPLQLIGGLFAFFGAAAILCGFAMAIATAIAGRHLAERRRYTYCMVVAALMCMFMPFGTVLGVLTIIVLNRPQVRAAFSS